MRESGIWSTDSVENVSYSETEMEVREVLRLAVAICCPDLPMMLAEMRYIYLWEVIS